MREGAVAPEGYSLRNPPAPVELSLPETYEPVG